MSRAQPAAANDAAPRDPGPRPPEAVFEAARRLARAAAFKHVRAMQAAAARGQGAT